MYLLDTNVVSELRKANTRKADKNVMAWAQQVSSSKLFISVVTVLELETGILQLERKDQNQGEVLRQWLESHVLPAFENRTLDLNTVIARQCAKLHVPDPRSDRDAMIAASALVFDMTVVTRNTKDFEHTGVSLLNPWEFKKPKR